MANLNVIGGLDPMPDASGNVNVRPLMPISAAVNGTFPLFKGSPYQINNGTVAAFDWETDAAALCAGSVVKLYAADGKTEILNIQEGTDGFADVTYDKDQRYLVVMSGTGFADNGSDNGKTYGLTSETATSDPSGMDGSGNSSVQANTATEDASANTFMASFKVQKPGNLGGVDKTLVEGKINPACHQAW